MPKRIIGLDISARRLLAVEVEGSTSRHPKLVRTHAVALPEGAARDSEVVNVPEVSQALRTLWKEGGFRSKRVVLGVGNQRVLVRDHTVPMIPLDQLRQSLPFQVADLLPVPVNETILDFYPIAEVPDSAPPEMRGLLVAAIKDSIETNVTTLEDAGLKTVGVDLSPFAMIRAITAGGPITGSHTVVMIGAHTTYIVVILDGVPQFVRIVPAGGDTLTEAAEEATGMNQQDAEELKYRIGIEKGADPEYRDAADAMLGALRSIFGSIRSTNSYYLGNYPGSSIAGIILLGQETLVPGLARAVTEHVGLPTVVGDPLHGLQVSDEIAPDALAALTPDLAIPLGLALGSK